MEYGRHCAQKFTKFGFHWLNLEFQVMKPMFHKSTVETRVWQPIAANQKYINNNNNKVFFIKKSVVQKVKLKMYIDPLLPK